MTKTSCDNLPPGQYHVEVKLVTTIVVDKDDELTEFDLLDECRGNTSEMVDWKVTPVTRR